MIGKKMKKNPTETELHQLALDNIDCSTNIEPKKAPFLEKDATAFPANNKSQQKYSDSEK